MNARHFLTIVAILQGGLLAALFVLIVLNRWFRLRRSSRLNPRREAVDASMRRWMRRVRASAAGHCGAAAPSGSIAPCT